jgi:hypothetical protein
VALNVNGKILRMMSSRGQCVAKLGKQRVNESREQRQGERLDPGHGKVMKDWTRHAPNDRLNQQV